VPSTRPVASFSSVTAKLAPVIVIALPFADAPKWTLAFEARWSATANSVRPSAAFTT